MCSAKVADIESAVAAGQAHVEDSLALRWAFIRKVYAILIFQFLLTGGVTTGVVLVKPIKGFLLHTHLGIVIYVIVLALPVIMMYPLFACRKTHPLNVVLLGIITVIIAFGLGLACSIIKWEIVLELGILKCALVVTLALYTFWAEKRGHDFTSCLPFVFGCLVILLIFGLIQVLHPLGEISRMILSLAAVIFYCLVLVSNTDRMMKKSDYDDYVWAAGMLYPNVAAIFLGWLGICNGLHLI